MCRHEKTFFVPWRPTSKARMHFASSFLVPVVLYFISSISGVSAQYYCLYNLQNTGSNFALVRHAPDPGSTGTWYQATFVHNGNLLSLFAHFLSHFFPKFPISLKSSWYMRTPFSPLFRLHFSTQSKELTFLFFMQGIAWLEPQCMAPYLIIQRHPTIGLLLSIPNLLATRLWSSPMVW